MRGIRPIFLSCAVVAWVALSGCRTVSVVALKRTDVRVELTNQMVATLDRQEHYFDSPDSRLAFAERLHEIAAATEEPGAFYSAIANELATLGEGHTGLVGSASVPFSETIPPVAILEVDRQFVIAGVAPGIEGGGLKTGDLLLEIDGVKASVALDQRVSVTPGSTPHGQRARAVATVLAGRTDQPARVRVRGTDGADRLCYPLRFLLEDAGVERVRFGFLPERVRARRISPSCVYVAFPDFHPDRREQFEKIVRAARDIPTMVLDLRGNPGGRIRTLQRVAGLFLDEAVPLLTMREGTQEEKVVARLSALTYAGRLRILIDERTGSAAELLAAALRDLGRAELLGRPTAGSTRSRQSVMLPGGVLFHYAGTTEFLRRDGTRVEGVGVAPDVTYQPSRDILSAGVYGDPYRDPLVRLAAR